MFLVLHDKKFLRTYFSPSLQKFLRGPFYFFLSFFTKKVVEKSLMDTKHTNLALKKIKKLMFILFFRPGSSGAGSNRLACRIRPAGQRLPIPYLIYRNNFCGIINIYNKNQRHCGKLLQGWATFLTWGGQINLKKIPKSRIKNMPKKY